MKTRKILKKIIFGLICLSVLFLIGLTIFQHQQIKRLSQGVSQETSTNSKPAGDAISVVDETVQNSATQSTIPAGKGKEPDKDEINDLEYQLDAAEEELDMAHEQLSDELSKKAELKRAEIELQKKYREDPSYKLALRKSLETQYGDFFKELDFSPEKLEKFMNVLVDNQMASYEFYLELQSVIPSEEKRAEYEQRSKNFYEENNAKIKEFLGDKDYQKYQAYQETWSLKYNITKFMDTLGSGEELNETQQQKYVEAVKEEMKNIRSEFSDGENKFLFPLERYEEKNMERSMKNLADTYEAHVKAAQNILSPSQVEQYKAYLKQQLDRYESSMKLQALRYGVQTTQKSTEKKSE